METQCNEVLFDFQGQNRRDVVATFDGGTITTDGGALLLREVERHTGVIAGFSACFTDHRTPKLIEHTLEHLIVSVSTPSRWAMKISMTMTNFEMIRCLRCWRARMILCTAAAAIWKTVSKNSSCACLPTVQSLLRCVPISYGYCFRQLPIP